MPDQKRLELGLEDAAAGRKLSGLGRGTMAGQNHFNQLDCATMAAHPSGAQCLGRRHGRMLAFGMKKGDVRRSI
jgi:hypothetical protein